MHSSLSARYPASLTCNHTLCVVVFIVQSRWIEFCSCLSMFTADPTQISPEYYQWLHLSPTSKPDEVDVLLSCGVERVFNIGSSIPPKSYHALWNVSALFLVFVWLEVSIFSQ